MNCHEAHSATLVAEGNAVCTQCHSPAGNPEFPTLALQDYDTPEHHFHFEGSDGAQCKSCHMAERTYMQVDGRRDQRGCQVLVQPGMRLRLQRKAGT